METSSKLFKKDWIEMKPIKFPFMKGCGYASEKYIISFYNNGKIGIYDYINKINIPNNFPFLNHIYFLTGLQNNNIGKFNETKLLILYNKIFDRLKNDT